MRKPKTYYDRDYSRLAHDWVAGLCAHNARTRDRATFADGNAIYSYSHRFCIARRFVAPDTGMTWFLFTDRDYSHTTRRHKDAVFAAIPRSMRVLLPQVDDIRGIVTEADLGKRARDYAVHKLEIAIAKYLRSIKPAWMSRMYMQFAEAREAVNRFGLRFPGKLWARQKDIDAHYSKRAERNRVLDAMHRLVPA